LIIKPNPLVNLHTHTELCQHAKGRVEDYCHVADHLGMEVLGISDHTPLPDGRWPGERMHMNELELYCKQIDRAREKYTTLKVLKGMECEYDKKYHSFFEDVLLGELKFDYLIGAVHYFPHEGRWSRVFTDMLDTSVFLSYSKHVITTLESGLFNFIAHPDIFGYMIPDWDENGEACARDILAAASELNIPLEINGNGYSKKKLITAKGPRFRYPWFKFWEIASEYTIEFVANSDAHKPSRVNAHINDAIRLGEYYNLSPASLLIP